MSAAGTFAIASAGLDLLSGLFGYFAGAQMQQAAESRGRMIRMEAEAEAQRYAEQARSFTARQKLAYLKSGVTLSGSPLDVMDDDILTAQENIAAIRARGDMGQADAETQGEQSMLAGRSALLSGIVGATKTSLNYAYFNSKADTTATTNRKNIY